MKTPTRILISSIAALLAFQARGGLQIPYTTNDNTLHLWHFDGALTNLDGTTNIVTPDAVSGGITMTNYGQPFSSFNNAGTYPYGAYTNASLGNPAFSGQSNALHLFDPNKLASGNLSAFAYGGVYGPAATFANPTSGAFTFEALVKLDANAFVANNGNWEIICGDGNFNGNNNRGWQFRIQSGAIPSLNFNAFPGNNAAVNNLTANLPNSGSDAFAVGQWYHVGLTYTGGSPTNGDTAGILSFYWTLLDANRTYADVLSQITVGSGFGFTAAGNTQLGIGGSGRNFSGTLANNEGFKGYIDEARMSIVCLKSNEMAFTTGGSLNPPSFLQQPPANTLVGFGKTLTLATLPTGTQPLISQWQQNGTGGYTNVPNQTNSALLTTATFASAGDYRLVVTNAYGSKTSTVAHVTVLASLDELFATGVDTNGALPAGGAGVVDPHYKLTQSADAAQLGPDAIIWNMSAFPIALNGGNFENPDGVSQWVGPQNNSYNSPAGQYVFRTTFLVAAGDPATASLQGIWWVNTGGTDLLLNGNSTGLKNTIAQKPGTGFTITNGFIAGLNTLDFVITNSGAGGAYPETAFRVEMSGLAQPLAAGLPVITNQPVSQTVHDGSLGGQSVASFAVVALGRPPLTYQWWADGVPLTDVTNRTLTFVSPIQGAQGTNFSVVIRNDSGSVTSQVAKLTILSTNQPPVAPAYSYTIYSNTTLNVSIDALYVASSDPDGGPLTISWDITSTNGGSVAQTGITLTYTPAVPNYVGADQFNYNISDGIDTTISPININVVPLQAPSAFSATHSGNNIVLSGGGGSPGGSFQVLSSTDITTPLANWAAAGTGTFNGSGTFNVVKPISPGVPQTFYIISVP